MKGFAITLDALLALSLIFFALIFISTQTFQPYAPRGTYLKQVSLDTLAVLEKTGRLGAAIDGDGASAREMVQATPENVCMQVSVTDGAGNALFTISKAGCYGFGSELQSAVVPFAYNGGNYLAEAKAWHRKVPE